MKQNTIHKRANEMFDNGEIKGRIKQLQDKLANSRNITLESQIKELDVLRVLSKNAEKYNDAINALKEQNKLLALYKEHNEQKRESIRILSYNSLVDDPANDSPKKNSIPS